MSLNAEEHLKNAEDFNTNNANSALSSFWKKDDKSALEFIGYAENELNLAEKSFSASGKTEIKLQRRLQEKQKKLIKLLVLGGIA